MSVEHSNFLPGGSLAPMFRFFVLMVLCWKLMVDHWSTMSSEYAGGFFVLAVNAGQENYKMAKSSLQDYIVILIEGLNCKTPVFLAEDWLRPPLRM